MRNYKSVKETPTGLAEIIKIVNSDVEVFTDRQLLYKFRDEPTELRRQLKSIAKFCTDHFNYFGNKFGKGKAIGAGFGTYEIAQIVSFSIADNKLDFRPRKLVSVLQSIDARRLKICPICDQVFWAKRLNSKTCGDKKCVETLGGKTYHRENKDVINRRKREKYYVDNDIDYCKTCVRPMKTHNYSDCELNKGTKNNGNL